MFIILGNKRASWSEDDLRQAKQAELELRAEYFDPFKARVCHTRLCRAPSAPWPRQWQCSTAGLRSGVRPWHACRRLVSCYVPTPPGPLPASAVLARGAGPPWSQGRQEQGRRQQLGQAVAHLAAGTHEGPWVRADRTIQGRTSTQATQNRTSSRQLAPWPLARGDTGHLSPFPRRSMFATYTYATKMTPCLGPIARPLGFATQSASTSAGSL